MSNVVQFKPRSEARFTRYGCETVNEFLDYLTRDGHKIHEKVFAEVNSQAILSAEGSLEYGFEIVWRIDRDGGYELYGIHDLEPDGSVILAIPIMSNYHGEVKSYDFK